MPAPWAALGPRYRLACFHFLQLLEKTGLPDRLYITICGWLWMLFGEDTERYGEFRRIGKRFSLPLGLATWLKFRRLRGVSIACMLRLHRWADASGGRPRLAVENAELVIPPANDGARGVLVLTYHHHFNSTFCALLGRYAGKVNVFAADPRNSPIYQRFKRFAKIMYGVSESFFRGGRYLYVEQETNMKQARAMATAFNSDALLVSVHDFPAARKPCLAGFFYNPEVCYPTGAIELALARSMPIVFAFLQWQGGDRFKLCFRPCQANNSVRAVLDSYFATLIKEFQPQPEYWEYWQSLATPEERA